MKYLCLAYYDREKFEAMPKDELRALVSQCPAHDEQLRASGRLVLQASLGSPESAVTLRPRGGKPTVTDGPFAEAKEMVGGVFLIEATSREEAVQVASKHPAAHLGEEVGWAVEIWPLGGFQQF
jgi:hypothetical protein